MEFLSLPQGTLNWNPALIAHWTALAASSGKPDPFCCSPAWQLAFHDALTPGSRLFVHADSENVLSFSEFFLSESKSFLLTPESSWLSGCPLLGKEPDTLLESTFPFLKDTYGGRLPRFLICGVDESDEMMRRMEKRFGRTFRFIRLSPNMQRSASLEGGLDGYLSRRSGNFRAKMKKARRNADAAGMTFVAATPVDREQAEAIYARMLSVEQRSWKGIQHCGMTETPSCEFYRNMLLRLVPTGEARVMFAVLDGKDVGFIFGGICGSHYRGQQFSYDADYARFSIGDLLQLEQIRRLCLEGVTVYDMGMSDEPSMAYKVHWAETELKLCAWLMLSIDS